MTTSTAISLDFHHSFRPIPVNNSQDILTNIHGINNYSVPPWQSNPTFGHQQSPAEASTASESGSECYTEGTPSY